MSVRVRFADFELDPGAASLTKAGEPVLLPSRVLQALMLLVERPGAVVSNDELFRRLWPNTYVRADALARVARHLRAALADNAAAPQFLETVPGRGFRFIARVESVEIADDSSGSGHVAG